jgi:hypothetical protein
MLNAARPANDLSVTVLDHTKVKRCPGFEIRNLTTGFESCWIVIEQIPPHRDLISVKARYENAPAAIEATTALNGIAGVREKGHRPPSGHRFHRRVRACGTTHAYTFHDDLLVRMGFLDTPPFGTQRKPSRPHNAHMCDGTLSARAIIMVQQSLASHTVRFEGLPLAATAKDLHRFGPVEVAMLKDPNYHSTGDAVAPIREKLVKSSLSMSSSPISQESTFTHGHISRLPHT